MKSQCWTEIRIRNERIGGKTKVGEMSKKVQKSSLKWCEPECEEKENTWEKMRKRRKGRPKRLCMDSTRHDLTKKGYWDYEALD